MKPLDLLRLDIGNEEKKSNMTPKFLNRKTEKREFQLKSKFPEAYKPLHELSLASLLRNTKLAKSHITRSCISIYPLGRVVALGLHIHYSRFLKHSSFSF